MFFGRIIHSVRYYDLASSIKTSADNTAGVRMHSTSEGYRIITDIRHGRFTPFERDRLILNTAKRDGPGTIIRTEQEGGSSGPSVTAHYAKLLHGYSYRGDKPGTDKWTRAQSFASYAQNGLVIVLVGGWLKKFYDELEAFPNGRHDDICDACSGAHNTLSALDGQYSVPIIGMTNTDRDLDNAGIKDDMSDLPEGSTLRSIVEGLGRSVYDNEFDNK